MTQEELEGNRIIAEFMNEKIDLDRWGKNWGRILRHHILNEIPTYHSSWDWLNPVIKRIVEDWNGSKLYNDKRLPDAMGSIILNNSIPINYIMDIKEMFKAVVEYIQWTNEQMETVWNR